MRDRLSFACPKSAFLRCSSNECFASCQLPRHPACCYCGFAHLFQSRQLICTMKAILRTCSALLLIWLCVACGPTLSAAEATKPNIIFILSDDVGLGNISCYGGHFKT